MSARDCKILVERMSQAYDSKMCCASCCHRTSSDNAAMHVKRSIDRNMKKHTRSELLELRDELLFKQPSDCPTACSLAT